MSSEFNTGSPTSAVSLAITGTGGAGYINLAPQTTIPTAPVGGYSLYADGMNNLTWKDSAGKVFQIDTSSSTTSNTWTLPNTTDDIVTTTSINVLTNKTFSSADNIVDANRIIQAPIVGVPITGDVLAYNSSIPRWQPLTLSATAPITYSSGTIGASVGSSAGTIAAGNDARFSSPQIRIVKASGVGAGEYSSIAAAIASITDAGPTKSYIVNVHPGTYVTGAITIPPYITVSGGGAGSSTIIVPATPGSVLFTVQTRGGLNGCVLYGPGIGGGTAVLIDSATELFMNNLVFAGFDTFISARASTANTSFTLFECEFTESYATGVLIDGTVGTSAHDINAILTNITVSGNASTTSIFDARGPFADMIVSNCIFKNVPNAIAINAEDGAEVLLESIAIDHCNIGIQASSVGAGPIIRTSGVSIFDSITKGLNILHPATNGIFSGIVSRADVFVDPAAQIALFFTDPVDNGTIIVGDLGYAPFNGAVITEHGSLLESTADIGVYQGGNVSAGAGLAVNVSAGEGYVTTGTYPTHQILKAVWSAGSVSLSADTLYYIYVTSGGVCSASMSFPDQYATIILARVRTTAIGIEFIDPQRYNAFHFAETTRMLSREAIGALYSTGSIVAANVSRELSVSSGRYFYLSNLIQPTGITYGTAWFAYYHTGGVWARSSQTIVDNAQYDNGTNLTAIPAGQFVKHTMYTVGSGSAELYFIVYGQSSFVDLPSAIAGNVATPPNYFGEGIVPIAHIICQQGVAAVSQINDARPSIGSSGSTFAAVTDHGQLTGLTDDDHPQYLLVNGSRAMTGGLNLGTNAITNAGLINGVNITTHATRHLPNGADPLTTAAPITTLTSATTNAIGTANSFARSDHTHAIDQTTFALNSIGGTLGVAKGGTGAAALTSGNFLIGAGTGTVTTTKVAPAGAVVGSTDAQTLTNKIIIGSTNSVDASALQTTGAAVIVSGSAAPTAGQALIANSATTAGWAAPGAALVDTNTAVIDATDSTKKIKFDAGGLTETTTTLAASQSADRTLTLPDATDTLIGRNTTDILANKTLIAGSTAVVDGTDPTKILNFNMSAAATGTTTTIRGSRSAGTSTLILPDIAADTLMSSTNTASLTNKTIIGSTNTVEASGLRTTGASVTLASAAPPIAGQVLAATSATTAAWSAPGSALVDAVTAIVDNVDATKKIMFDAGGTTGTSTTILAAQTASRVITLPDATDTLIGRLTTDTIANKILSDNTCLFANTTDNTKKLQISTGGATTATTTILAVTSSADATLTLPSATDTLIGRVTADTLQNKNLFDANCAFVDDSDPTRKLQFAVGGTPGIITTLASASTANRTITLPDATDALVARATVDTFTNKTIIGATNIVEASGLRTTGASVSVSPAAPPVTGQVLTATSATTAAWSAPGSALVDTVTAIVDSGDATKKIMFDAGGTTGTTTTLAVAQTASRVLMLPDASTTIVGTDVSQNLTNKTIIGATNTVDASGLQTTGASVILSAAGPPTIGQVLAATSATTAAWSAPGAALVDSVTAIVDSTDATKKIMFDAGGATGTTTTILAAQTAARTLTLPNATDTLIGRATTDSLSNKSLDPASVTFADTGVPAKILAVSLTGATAGTTIAASATATSVLTLPNAASDTIVGASTAATLANKFLSDSTTRFVDSADTSKQLAFDVQNASGVTTTITTANTAAASLAIPAVTSGAFVITTAPQTVSSKELVNSCFWSDGSTKQLQIGFSTAGANSTTILAPTTTASTTSTISMPSASTMLVGRDTVDTLSNKSLSDDTTVIVDSADATRTLTFNIAGTTGTTTTIAALPTANRTVTLPNATDTLVGLATADILQNKTFASGSCEFADIGDTTKRVAFGVSGASAGTKTTLAFAQTATRTITFQNASDTVVMRDTSDTLTNKTLTTPIISQIVNGGTLTLPAGTDTIVGRTTADTLTNKTITGTTNTVDANALKTTGASVSVSAAAPPSVGQALVATSATTAVWQNVTSSLVDTTTFIVDSTDITKRIGFDAGGTAGTTTTLTTAATASRVLTLPDATDTLIGRVTTDTLQNKTLLTPVIAQIVNSGTLTLPTASDTLVGRVTTDTLQNKTLITPVIAQIVNSGTLTLPTATDTIVGRATTDILTNKTITGITNIVDATALKTAGASVSVAAAGPPSIGHALIATSSTSAAWSAPGASLIDNVTAIVDSADNTKKILFDAGGTTGTATTITAAQTAARTISLPDATDMLVGRATMDTLSNKLLVDGSTYWANTSDTTKKLAINLTNMSTGTTNTLAMPSGGPFTWTLPDATSTLVGRTTTDTLTNKTILGSTNNVDANALKTTGASVTVASAAPPSAGQVLIATSATSAAWAAPGAALVDNATFVVDAVDATKRIGFDAGGTTGTTTTLAFAQTSSRTLTMPDTTDTLVARATADTLTNKTIIGATNTVESSALRTTTAPVVISTAAAPSAGYALIATSATSAAWSAPGASLIDTATFIVDAGDVTKRIGFNAGGTTGTTTTLIAAQTASRTIMLPDASDTLIGLATADILTNKTFIAANCNFADATDNSKRVAFSASGSSAAATLTLAASVTTNRTLILPNATDTIVARSTVDSLSNKTLDWTNTRFADVGVPAKTFGVDLSAASAGVTIASSATTTSVLTLPNTPADTIVSESTSAILSNKILRTTTCSFGDTIDTTKRMAFAVSGATTGATMTLVAAQTAARVLTLPDATDTIVARGTVDMLTNKTISADNSRWADTTDSTKRLAVSLTGALTGTTTTLLAAQTVNRAISLPDATDTLVGRNTADLLANKSLADSTCKWVNTTDTTKQLIFSLGAMTTGTTHSIVLPAGAAATWTMPAASDVLVGRATTDTLTNKTITGASNTVDANALKTTGASVSVSAAAPPTTGQILTATSATAAIWSTPVVSAVVDNVFAVVDSGDATKRIAFNAGGNTSTTTTLAASQTADRTLTLPDISDTLVGQTTVDTLSNKSLIAGNCAFVDGSDTTKKIITVVSGATTGTTTTIAAMQTVSRVLTLPDITDTLVTNTNSADLSNKRLLDTTAMFAGTIDSTKTLRFNLAGMATATQHTFIMPGGSAQSWTLPAASDTLIGLATTDTLTNKTITGASNTVDANALKTTGASVTVAGAAPPSAGQALIAASATTATWQPITVTSAVDNIFTINDSSDATKQIKFDAGGITGTSTTFAAAQTVSRVLTLPDVTDTIVARTTADVLTNKTFIAGSCEFADGGDTTKRIAMLATGTTPGITTTIAAVSTAARILTLPDATDTLVALTTTDTLTNKTITGATNTVDANALKTTGASVTVAGAAPPSTGQALVATSATTATWSTPWNTLVDTAVAIVDSVDATKQILFNSGGTTGTSTTFAVAQTASRVLTLPDVSDTLVALTTTDTLTNKTITGATNTVDANALKTTGASVTVAGAAPPSTGQALVATSATTATWQPIMVTSAVDNIFTINDSSDATKQIKFDAGGTTGTSTTFAAAQTVSRVLTLPDATDVLVGVNTTNTLANKLLQTTTCSFGDTTDTTKRIVFTVAGATTGTAMTIASAHTADRTLTLPNVTDTLVARTTTDTFTNKTIIGGSNGNTVSADQLRGVDIAVTAPTISQILTYDGTSWAPATPAGGGIIRWIVQEIRSVGVNSGALTGGTWNTRTLTTLTGSANSSLTISSNTMIFTAGTYYIRASAPANRVGLHKARLWNVGSATVLVEGTSSITPVSDIGETLSIVETYQTFASTTTLRLEHYVQNTSLFDGGGAATGVGTNERYVSIMVDKLA